MLCIVAWCLMRLVISSSIATVSLSAILGLAIKDLSPRSRGLCMNWCGLCVRS
ncbi:hypothetical protein BDR03DRAFT_958220 [Suillus americanus]|nr:hypothetical protein BDR03DRAFT_958220 [Suillus americanus]